MSLLKKAFAEDPITSAVCATLSVVCPLVPVALVAADAAGIAGKAIAKTAKALKPAPKPKPEPSRALVPAKPSSSVQQAPPVDPLDLAQRQYIALQERICQLPLGDAGKKRLHRAAERRFIKALEDRLRG